MSNELNTPDGFPITLHFMKANPVENTTTALTFDQGGAGFKVPTGYKFHALCLHAECNANPTTGTATFNVTANTTALANGPTVVLVPNTQVGVDVHRPGEEPIAAGKIVGVNVVADVNWAANSIDVDAVLVGLLRPA